MSEPFLGQIKIFAGNFAPRGWAFCNGQLLDIAQNTALFSLLGTTYGGDGRTTFALPDLQGRVCMHPGFGPGLTTRRLGESGGAETHTLTENEMPSHTHQSQCDSNPAASDTPVANIPAESAAGINTYAMDADGNMNSSTIAGAGGGQSHDNMQPNLVMNYVIALTGIYPARD